MNILEKHTVPNSITPTRLQEYAVGIFTFASTKSAIKKAIKKERLLVNQKPSTTALIIKGGEEIILTEEKNLHKPFHLELKVLYEDDYLAAVEKPAGVSVSGNYFATIDNALTANIKLSSMYDAVRPRPVHRLDYPTSGVLLIGKTMSCIQRLNTMFENHQIQKTYYAVSIGKMPTRGEIEQPIDSKESLSIFEVEQSIPSLRFEHLNLVKLSPKSGRRHQLRKHLSYIGNPILGDKDYGFPGLILYGKGLYLHAFSIQFNHPFTKKAIDISSSLPKKFIKLFQEV